MISSQPFDEIREVGLTEIVDADHQVDQNDFSATADLTVGVGGLTASGEFLSVVLVTTENGSGAVLSPAGKLILLDADPNTTAGDTALTAAEWKTAIGYVDVNTSDWVTDANGGLAFKQIAVPFHDLTAVYAVWFHEDATSFNDAAGDDEEMHINLWYRRDS